MSDDALLPAPPHDPDAIREAADQLLQQRRYAEGLGLGKADPEGFLDVLWDRVTGLVQALIDLQESNPVLYWLFIGGLVLLATAMIAHIIYTVRRGSAAAPADAARTVQDLVSETDLEALRRRVLQAETAGDLGAALRARFALSVASVLGVARLRVLGHLTYRELVQLARHHGGPEGLGEAMIAIEESYYAGRPLDEQRYRHCVAGLCAEAHR